jgi:hypothetical protein
MLTATTLLRIRPRALDLLHLPSLLVQFTYACVPDPAGTPALLDVLRHSGGVQI